MTIVVTESCIRCKHTDCADATALNAELAKVRKPIIEMKPALPDADAWAQVRNKLDQLRR